MFTKNLGHGLGHGQTSDTRVRSSLYTVDELSLKWPKPSPTSFSYTQHISSPTSNTNIDVTTKCRNIILVIDDKQSAINTAQELTAFGIFANSCSKETFL